jgi:hypothetical protein
MVDILNKVWTADWDRERLNMSLKHYSQLVYACYEDAARDAVWTGSLTRVNPRRPQSRRANSPW